MIHKIQSVFIKEPCFKYIIDNELFIILYKKYVLVLRTSFYVADLILFIYISIHSYFAIHNECTLNPTTIAHTQLIFYWVWHLKMRGIIDELRIETTLKRNTQPETNCNGENCLWNWMIANQI